MSNSLSVVTGAAGLLGSYITEVLMQRGLPVRALARPSSELSFLRRLNVETRLGDLTDAAFARDAIEGAAIVYHCAGRITNWGPWDDFDRGNIRVTQNVADAVRHHHVPRLVHVSSMAVYGHPVFGSELLTEDEPLGQRPWSYDYYNRSKIAAEEIVAPLGPTATIVRPTWFYGPRDHAFVPRVLRRLKKRAVWIIGSRENQLNGLYVTDLAEACVAAGTVPMAAGQSYNLCNEGGMTQQELYDILCDGFDLPRVRRRVPLKVAHHFAHLVESAARVRRQQEPPSISRHALSVLARPARFSAAKARQELGWKPSVHHVDGLKKTIDWIKRGEPSDELVIAQASSAEAPRTVMKVSVLGAGAIGCWFGGRLAQRCPELDVTLFARGSHGDQLRRSGELVLREGAQTQRIPVRLAEQIEELAGSDLVLLTVKSQATREAISTAAPHLGDALVVSIQNGINQNVLSEFVSQDRLVMGMTASNMAIIDPGTVDLQRDGPTVVGPASPELSLTGTQRAAGLLRESGMRIIEEQNLLGAQYNKMVFNALGCASALSASNIISEGILDKAWRREVAWPLHNECTAIIESAGIRLARTASLSDVQRFRRLLRLLDNPLSGPVIKLIAGAFFNARPILFSVRVDLENGKPTEIESLNGQFVRLAHDRGREAPYNRLVVSLVRELEGRPNPQFFDRSEVIEAFRRLSR